ncbi:50S ribosomal protein L6 (chloroplast) [Nannochloropsis gaditana]|uniref:Large ribosomal subunit protein uL6c n=1 Tax=Nannochloropsis gaditana TaxID=72520 RepID=K9ZXJ2_9STRA|nr:50S ribosomal protein L6 [Nannochloropsis gaditana]AFZ64261.1 50S ribosomal protein L6 [Nannochloropsis gaditana]AGI98632.1 ribosomal protein L6 [Nannochloropsis gaditana]AHX25157.1 50S ribosomal protein L6 [Nannochloropsis gaditana]
MSRIGKQIIKIPAGVNIQLTETNVQVKGPKGEISRDIPSCLSVIFNKDENTLQILRKNENISSREVHGLFRSLVSNMVIGSSTGFTTILELKGVGYKANMDKTTLNLSVGYTHPIRIDAPEGIQISVEANTTIKISGINKEKVGLVAQQIRSTRPPEPYKGKGVLYQGEVIQRKVGKSSK